MNNKLKNLEIEQIVLGCFFIDRYTINKIKKIKTDFFYYDYHKIIFDCLVKLLNENKPIDIAIVAEELTSTGKLEYIGGITYISSLVTVVPTTSNLDYYIDILQELYNRRVLINHLKEVGEFIIDKSKSLNEISTMFEELKKIATNSESIKSSYIDIESIQYCDDKINTIPTGLKKLDCLLSDHSSGGLQYGTLTVWTGEPSSGKSTLLNQIMAEAILNNNKVFIYSGELPNNKLKEWFVRTVSNIEHLETYKNNLGIISKTITKDGWNLVSKWAKNKIFIYGDDSDVSENNLISTIEYLYLSKGVRLFILDNLMTINYNANDNKYSNQEKIASSLKKLARKYDLVIILVAHPKKNQYVSQPTMYDVAGASEIVNYADYVIRSVRCDDDNAKVKSGLMILKNRLGSRQDIIIQVKFDKERKRFYTDDLELNKYYYTN